ncbi:hypothetical protein [Bacillus rubiinfantis]|uniref:hypothetical protein n=1 Tax=Bacillus rubiinfantis TaxID=1499680 RepID=UPI0005AA103C|nr:hypothetical protein [Bacillus rubiinfantis]
MKKLALLLCGIIISFTMMLPVNSVQAAEVDDDCGCHDLIPLQGKERNKIVAKFISSEAFKTVKKQAQKDGYNWNGAHAIEVVIPSEDVTMIGVPFTKKDGTVEIFVFINGVFVGTSPGE